MEMKFLRAILNKTKNRIRNTNIKLKLGVYEIKKTFKKLIKWFGHVMQMGEDKIPKKILHTKLEGKRPRGNPKIRWIDQIRKDIEYERRKLGSTTKKQEVGEERQLEISL